MTNQAGRKNLNVLILTLSTVFFFICNSLISQEPTHGQAFKVLLGERPLIDLSAVPSEAMEEGVILVKFKTEYSDYLDQFPPSQTKNGSWQFDIQAIDELNLRNNISSVEQYFATPAFEFTEKHKAWGFHLWYKLKTTTKSNIKDIVSQYSALSELAQAVPEFKKILIADPEQTENTEVLTQHDLERLVSNDPRFAEQWHYHNTGQSNGTFDADIDLPEAWTIEKGNPDVLVVVIDEGIQYSHPDLVGNMWQEIGYNFALGTSTIMPGSHGCHVGGTIAAVTDNGLGVAGIAGGTGNNDGVRLMSAQVFNEFNNGGFHFAPIWAADNGAAISQNSWGYTAPNVYDPAVLDAIDYFNTNGGGNALIGGGITIFAAGNDNSSANHYPAYYSGAFSVAATNNKDKKSYYSNYGNWVDISAPGGEVLSTSSGGVLSCVTNSGYAFYQGTSMACPHVSGVAALIISNAYGQLTPAQVADILRNSTDDHYAANPNYTGKLGTGRLNAHKALLETQNYLTGTLKPVGFSARAISTTEIQLSWMLNKNDNAVIIAWSQTDDFGTTAAGHNYEPGEIIPGGGTVLFSGKSTEFLHEDLSPATPYYYSIWAFDENLIYSDARPASASTWCPHYPLPFAENFEMENELPLCWYQEFKKGNINWEVGTGNNESNPPDSFNGNKNVLFKAQQKSDKGKITLLVLPEMNLAFYDSVELKFAFVNARRITQENDYQDILRVRCKPASHSEWQTISIFSDDVQDWTETSIILPDRTSTYRIAFEAESGRGYGICIDAVSVTGYGTAPTHTIIATAHENGSISPSGNIMAANHGNYPFLVRSNANYVIESLNVDDIVVEEAEELTQYEYIFNDIVNDHTITANFKLKNCRLNAASNPVNAGIIEGSGSYPYGSEVSLLAVPNEGYVFKRWFEGGALSDENPITFNIYSDRNFIAWFTPIIHILQVSVQQPEAGSVSGGGSYIHGTQVSVSGTSNHGYEFSYWTENGEIVSSDNPYYFNITSSRNLTANHDTAMWTISAVPDPVYGGNIEGAGIYRHGSSVILLANPNTNYIFKGWAENSVIIDSGNPFSFIADDHRTLTALFNLKTGIKTYDKQHIFNVYPNPCNGIFSLETSETASYIIRDLLGRSVLNGETTKGITRIDISNQARGMYFIEIHSESETKCLKIRIE